jgi:proteasome alpha subunit
MYDEPIDVEVVAKRVGDIKQLYTQHAGVRPFGVSIIFAGADKTGSRLFATDPSGSIRGWKALAVGVGKETVEGILKTEYDEKSDLETATKLAIKSLVKAQESRGEQPRVKIAVIPATTKKMKMLTEEEIETYRKSM